MTARPRRSIVMLAALAALAVTATLSPGLAAGSPARVDDTCGAPVGVSCWYDVPYGEGPYQTLDAYAPLGVTGEPSVVLIHGGGWTGGTARDLGAVAVYLAQNGFAVFSINYTLSTEGHGTWPQPFVDVETAAGWVRDHAADYAADGTRLAAVGDSAGAHLAALLNTAGPRTAFRC